MKIITSITFAVGSVFLADRVFNDTGLWALTFSIGYTSGLLVGLFLKD